MRRLLVNDCLSALPGHRTFWNDLQEWFDCEFVGGDFHSLNEKADVSATLIAVADSMPSLIIRNASYFGPLDASKHIPTISLLQDIFPDVQARKAQWDVMASCKTTVFNSEFTAREYPCGFADWNKRIQTSDSRIIPLPVDFSVFEPGNPMGLQQELSLPDNCICWVGACREAGHVKGWDIFIRLVRLNPDLHFVAVFKDQSPEQVPPNLRVYSQLSQPNLAKVMGACRVGLCTSRIESQHLAGIEMGACGLPMVAPNVGVYWKRDFPGIRLDEDASLESSLSRYTIAIRAELFGRGVGTWAAREYWRKEFDRSVVKEQWTKLIEEVEGAAL